MAHRSGVMGGWVALMIVWAPGSAAACDDPPKHYPAGCRLALAEFTPFVAVAEDKGFFKANRITVIVEEMSGMEVSRRLAASSDTVGYLSGAQAVRALALGVKLKIIAAPLNSVRLDLWVRAGGGAGKFTGGVVALGPPGSGSNLAFADTLRAAGVNPAGVKTSLAPVTQRVDDLARGAIDAALLPSHLESVLAKRGLVRVTVGKSITLAQYVIAVPEPLFRDDRNDEFLVGLLKSVGQSIEFAKANREPTTVIIRKRGITGEAIEEVYARYASAALTTDVGAGVRAVIEDMIVADPKDKPALQGIKVEDVVTPKFVQRTR